jgi:hypothetical protein
VCRDHNFNFPLTLTPALEEDTPGGCAGTLTLTLPCAAGGGHGSMSAQLGGYAVLLCAVCHTSAMNHLQSCQKLRVCPCAEHLVIAC